MGADRFYIFFGIRYTIETEAEIDRLEQRTDSRLLDAREAHLDTSWDRPTDGVAPFLLVGTKIGIFGVEGKANADFSGEELRRIEEGTKRKLREGGFREEPRYWFQVAAQY